jgi:RND family efflux transporter MFP subunit
VNDMQASRIHQLTAAALVALAGAGCSSSRGGSTGATAPPLPVSTAAVVMADSDASAEAGGVVQAQVTAMITARVLAPVREVRVVPGDRVRAGQVLVVLDATDLSAGAASARAAAEAASGGTRASAADVQAADAALALATATHDRIASLAARQSATAHELDEATAGLRAAEARAAGTRARAAQADFEVARLRAASLQAATVESFTRLTAPFDGLVTARMVEVGNMASPGTPLVRLEDTRRFRLELRIDESRARGLAPGVFLPVVLDDGSTRVQGRITEIARAVDADARSVLVKVELPEATGARSGVFGRALLPDTGRRVLTVPASAIVRRGQVTTVFVVDEGVARVRMVSLRGTDVLAGLTEGDVVILEPPAGLVDGRRVVTGGRR